ncbi:metalloregulator ArsR/SmtB family transcription factor [Gilvimarinus sp. SDUM040013]|uniref:Metalloregulator ArsR/SmtB family transcription factor n=1 Tax=Gilvimarinus gilvus TaxID=3058038 RepID=A0ABU4S2V7_9GAMM|nr:metalloregulator ArsR/SmtB family transcription factor [Gilvimarinus sp. SDUM040013]MDO3385496.1 metalloregulator ArsR/SmtB family transcription factor [Gilvimarinus sp. SDUM040013]MDX6851269.1 metalloregulator ArsR/SmtB family transcription factor [Gilvimarinus sp. SDUM040013]
MDHSQFFKCLADDTRLQCLLLMQQAGELCVCELTQALQLSQPKVSRHLAVLRQCGLLADRRKGKWVYYNLHPNLAGWMLNVLDTTLQDYRKGSSDFQRSLQLLASGAGRVCT